MENNIPIKISNSPQANQAPVIPLSKSNRFLILLVSILVLTSISLTTYFLYQNLQLKKQLNSSAQDSSVPSISPIPSPDPTTDWKTYTNTKLDFELKYPKDWVSPVKNEKNDKSIQFINSNSKLTVFIGPHYDPILQRNLTFEEYSIKAFGDETKREDYNLKTLVGKKTTVIDIDKSITESVILSKDNKSTVIINFSFKYSQNNPEEVKLFDQILSTFQFTQ